MLTTNCCCSKRRIRTIVVLFRNNDDSLFNIIWYYKIYVCTNIQCIHIVSYNIYTAAPQMSREKEIDFFVFIKLLLAYNFIFVERSRIYTFLFVRSNYFSTSFASAVPPFFSSTTIRTCIPVNIFSTATQWVFYFFSDWLFFFLSYINGIIFFFHFYYFIHIILKRLY